MVREYSPGGLALVRFGVASLAFLCWTLLRGALAGGAVALGGVALVNAGRVAAPRVTPAGPPRAECA